MTIVHAKRALLWSALLMATTTPAAARAASTSEPIADGTADQVQVQSDPAGNATAMWIERAAGKTLIRSASRAAGGDWSPPQTVVAGRTATTSTASEVTPIRLVAGAGGPPRILWAKVQHDNGAFRSIAVATRLADGTWSNVPVTAADLKPRIGASADLSETTDGTSILVWSTATIAPGEYAKTVAPGKLYAQTASPNGGWSSPVLLGRAAGESALPQIAVNRSGGAVVTWDRAEPSVRNDTQPLAISTRARNGVWTPSSATVTSDGGLQPPLLDEAGHTHLLINEDGNYGLAGLAHQLVGPGVTRAKPDEMLEPTKAQTDNGWYGSGYLRVVDAAIDGAGQVVVVWGGEPLDVESGGYGIGTLWSATRSTSGQWSDALIDPLTETTGASTVDLSTDDNGALAATWAVDTEAPACGSVIYRAMRGADAAWTARTIVASAGAGPVLNDDQGEAAGCQPVFAHSTDGAEPTIWWTEGTRLVLDSGPLTGVAPTPPTLTATVLTPTWADVRHAGGLSIGCITSSDGVCSASLVGAAASAMAGDTNQHGLQTTGATSTPAQLLDRSIGCFALRATAPVTTAQGGTVTLARSAACNHGWVPPTQSFSVLVTADAPGLPPASQRMDVTISR